MENLPCVVVSRLPNLSSSTSKVLHQIICSNIKSIFVTHAYNNHSASLRDDVRVVILTKSCEEIALTIVALVRSLMNEEEEKHSSFSPTSTTYSPFTENRSYNHSSSSRPSSTSNSTPSENSNYNHASSFSNASRPFENHNYNHSNKPSTSSHCQDLTM